MPDQDVELTDADAGLHYCEFENLTFARHNKVVNLNKLKLNLPKEIPFESQREQISVPLDSSEFLDQIECEYNID